MVNSKNKPLVSIITTVLNGEKYIGECIQSVLNQTYPNIEHIFKDGGSKDRTVEIIKHYSAKYPKRIRYISEPDKGAGDAWNRGRQIAKGDIFGWIGADDKYEPDAIETVVEFFKANLDASFVFGGCNTIDEKSNIFGKSVAKDFNLKDIVDNGCYVPTPASFYKRKVVEKIGLYSDKGNDFEYLLRIAQMFTVYRLDKTLCNFRVHKNSITTGSNLARRLWWLHEDYLVSRHYGGRFFSKYFRNYVLFTLAVALQPILGKTYPVMNKIWRRVKASN